MPKLVTTAALAAITFGTLAAPAAEARSVHRHRHYAASEHVYTYRRHRCVFGPVYGRAARAMIANSRSRFYGAPEHGFSPCGYPAYGYYGAGVYDYVGW